jgi:hypothetical protein
MHKTLSVLLVATLFLSGCSSWSSSSVNPSNWFGKSRSAPAATAEGAEATEGSVNPLIPARRSNILAGPEKPDPSVLIDSITELRIEREPSGAIVYASGVAARQGAYRAELRLEAQDTPPRNGILNLTFRVIYPERPTRVGTARSRTVIEAISLTTQQLKGVRVIRVAAAGNTRESRRR